MNTYHVRADHPILKRPDKHGLTYSEAKNYADKLKAAGYERIRFGPDEPTRLPAKLAERLGVL